MEEVLRAQLLALLIPVGFTAEQVSWGMRTAGAPLPAAVLHLVAGVPSMTMSGPSGWTRSRVQFDFWGRTYKAARDAADAAVAVLNGYRGTQGGIQLRTFVLNEMDGDSESDELGPVERRCLDLTVWHNP